MHKNDVGAFLPHDLADALGFQAEEIALGGVDRFGRQVCQIVAGFERNIPSHLYAEVDVLVAGNGRIVGIYNLE